ncbi:hypothetical protein [Burkholderia thailandensis]|uniref:hypothetical protein n=1 Tax=Burkholderia thailandensis TaxID=57975 RepID=UPI00139246D4|nr:hypothetical protein [Burkholderia thailandensis]
MISKRNRPQRHPPVQGNFQSSIARSLVVGIRRDEIILRIGTRNQRGARAPASTHRGFAGEPSTRSQVRRVRCDDASRPPISREPSIARTTQPSPSGGGIAPLDEKRPVEVWPSRHETGTASDRTAFRLAPITIRSHLNSMRSQASERTNKHIHDDGAAPLAIAAESSIAGRASSHEPLE